MSKLLENFNKFGVPLHSNMDEKEMAESWDKVDPKIKKNYSSITNSIKQLEAKKKVQDALNNTYVVNKKNLENMKNVLDMGAAVIQQQYQFPLLATAEKVSKVALTDVGSVLSSLKSSIF